MKADAEIKPDVARELQWDSQLSEQDSIGVAVKDGAVVLTGHIPTYAEKLAAARAAERVLRSQGRGQRAEGPDLFVGCLGEIPIGTPDSEQRRRGARALPIARRPAQRVPTAISHHRALREADQTGDVVPGCRDQRGRQVRHSRGRGPGLRTARADDGGLRTWRITAATTPTCW